MKYTLGRHDAAEVRLAHGEALRFTVSADGTYVTVEAPNATWLVSNRRGPAEVRLSSVDGGAK